MKDIFQELTAWVDEGKDIALATVVNTWRSAPRPVGACLAIDENSRMTGSVSGGCVEKSVVAKAVGLLKAGGGELMSFGVGDEDAWEVGLSCGGKIEVFIERFMGSSKSGEKDREVWQGLKSSVEDDKGCVVVTRMSGEKERFLYKDDKTIIGNASEGLAGQADDALKNRKSEMIVHEGEKYFMHVFTKKDKLLLVGSAHITSELISLAAFYGFNTTVIDPRDTFAKNTTYTTSPGRIFVEWPQEVMPDMELDEFTYAVNLSHDPKIDDESLAILLKSKVAYIGALGSKKTHEKRKARLLKRGFTEEEVARIHAPVGLDIGAALPGEIALSIMAEIIKVKNGH